LQEELRGTWAPFGGSHQQHLRSKTVVHPPFGTSIPDAWLSHQGCDSHLIIVFINAAATKINGENVFELRQLPNDAAVHG
jgi:hypothetical protein